MRCESERDVEWCRVEVEGDMWSGSICEVRERREEDVVEGRDGKVGKSVEEFEGGGLYGR